MAVSWVTSTYIAMYEIYVETTNVTSKWILYSFYNNTLFTNMKKLNKHCKKLRSGDLKSNRYSSRQYIFQKRQTPLVTCPLLYLISYIRLSLLGIPSKYTHHNLGYFILRLFGTFYKHFYLNSPIPYSPCYTKLWSVMV